MRTAFKTICLALLASLIFAFLAGFLAVADTPPMPQRGQFLMVDEEGEITPPGYTLGLDQIAQTAANVAAASNRVAAVAEATRNAQGVVSNLTEMLLGTTAFGYIDGFVVSFGGTASVSTNATCRIIDLRIAVESAGDQSCHYLYYVFSEPMNSDPLIKWKTSLTEGDWNFVQTQETTHFQDGTTYKGRSYDNLYMSKVWLPSSLNQAFFMAYCEIATPDGDGSLLPVYGGIKINGQIGVTGVVTNDGYRFTYNGGLLMAAPEAVE